MTTKEIEIQLALGSLSLADRLKVAESRRTSKKILTILSTDEDSRVRSWIADNRNTPIEILIKLSKDKEGSVRYWIASNPNTPVEALKILSKDEKWYIRDIVNKYK